MKIKSFLDLAIFACGIQICVAQQPQEKVHKGLKFTDKKILDEVDNAKPRLYGASRGGSRLPSSYDLTPFMPPPGNQGQEGSCAGWATAYALRTSQEKVENKWDVVQDDQIVTSRVFSPAYIYNQVNHGKDEGSYFTEIFQLMQNKGCATWASMPYSAGDYLSSPSDKAHTEADNYKIAWAKDIDAKDIGTIKSYITQGYPIVIGAQVDDAFEDLTAGKIVTSMSDGGGHAMVVVGYDDNKSGGCFKIMNSWGQNWGDNGFCWMTYDCFTKDIYEAWLVEDAPDGKTIDPPTDNNNQPYVTDEGDTAETFNFNDEVAAKVDLDSIFWGRTIKGYENYGKGIILEGFIDIDKDAGDSAQIVVYITNPDDENEAVPCSDENFSDVNNDLVGYTTYYKLSDFIDANGEYWVWVPNKFLKASGRQKLWAYPVLFVDGIDVAHGDPVIVTGY